MFPRRLRIEREPDRSVASSADGAGRAGTEGARARPWRRLGLRARVTVTFGVGALALSATMACLTYFTARQFILDERSTTNLRQAYVNASLARSTLRAPGADVTQMLDSLDTVPGSRSVLEWRGHWYATAFSLSVGGERAIPGSLRRLVVSGTPATQHYLLDDSPQMVVGVPIPSVDAAYFEVFSLSDVARTLRILAAALAGAALVTTVAGALTGRWASGRALRPLAEVSKAAETIAGGRLQTRLVATDDAELSALAGSFNRMADALQERIEREARFTSDVSHELRSPITTLSTALGVLDSHRHDLSARSQRALDLVTAELRRFQRMVDELLEISRLDTGSADLSVDDVEAGELFRQAAQAAGVRDVPVQVDAAADQLPLRVDKRRIERVVTNLVDNAGQYAGGVTRLSVEPAPGAVRFVVADRGPGVRRAERQRIFERFYRGQAAGQRGATDGTGLGLSLVAEHVRLHHGRVWVEENVDGENCFVVEIPTSGCLPPDDTPVHADGPGVDTSSPSPPSSPSASRARAASPGMPGDGSAGDGVQESTADGHAATPTGDGASGDGTPGDGTPGDSWGERHSSQRGVR